MTTHKLIQGDCLKAMQDIPDNSIDLIITDPPYNINKDSWDKIDNYFEWLNDVFVECDRVLKDNGTLWFFHMNFDALSKIHLNLINNTNFNHKQLIIINKGLQSITGKTSDKLRSFPTATEYLQFYIKEDLTGAEQISDKIASKNPFSIYLKSEFAKAGVLQYEISTLFPSINGKTTGCVTNWIKGYQIPLKWKYKKIKEHLNLNYNGDFLTKEYEELKKEYEELKKEYEDLRYTFNLPKGVTDVWDIDFYNEKKLNHLKLSHPTQKPIKIIERILNALSNENSLVLDCFAGSGTTLQACVNTQRNSINIEISEKYCKIIKERCFGQQSLFQKNTFEFGVLE